jgi:hypothetical protein
VWPLLCFHCDGCGHRDHDDDPAHRIAGRCPTVPALSQCRVCRNRGWRPRQFGDPEHLDRTAMNGVPTWHRATCDACWDQLPFLTLDGIAVDQPHSEPHPSVLLDMDRAPAARERLAAWLADNPTGTY